MILDESAFSDIDDDAVLPEITDAAYHGADIRPAWIGAHRPRTSIQPLMGICGWAGTHYDYYLNFVREYMERRGDVLDVGCGTGQCTGMLARYAEFAEGIDADKAVIEFARKWNAGRRTSFFNGSFPDGAVGAYDYIFCIETIEHVAYEQQAAFIDAALARLRPGGLMFLTTPNEESAGAPHVGIWTQAKAAAMQTRLGERVVRRAYFSNVKPTEFRDEPSTHHAWVMR